MKTRLLALIALALIAIACAGEEILTQLPPDTLYNRAVASMKDKHYESAQRYLDAIREEHPFSPYAVEAELLNADMLFQQEMYRAAITSYQAFEELHPFHEKAPYASFRRGLSTFNLIDTPDRDVTAAAEAAEILKRFVKQNPDHPHAAEAKEKIASAVETLATHELIVAKYYIKKEKPEAARERLRELLKNYPESNAAMEGRKLEEGLKTGTNPPR